MEFLTELWLPIVLSAVFVFIVSSVAHMLLPYHKSDWKKLKDEEGMLESMRGHGLEPGEYMFPMPDCMKDMDTPEMKAKFEKGPVGHMTVFAPGSWGMGKSLAQWFVFCLLMGVFVAYVGFNTRAAGADYLAVFRVVGAVAFIGYGASAITNSIWKGTAWSTTLKFQFDGLLYALTTAGTFAWMWPDAAG